MTAGNALRRRRGSSRGSSLRGGGKTPRVRPAQCPTRLRRHRRGATFLAMRYLSTRDAGNMPAARSFEDVLLAGLAEDGGLYVPDRLPPLGPEGLRELAGLPYAELAARIV